MRIKTITVEDVAIISTTVYDTQPLEHIYGYSVQFKWTSTVADAEIKLQASNDGENWDDVTGASFLINNSSDSKLFNVPDAMYKFVRVFLDVTAGTVDTFKIITNIKGI